MTKITKMVLGVSIALLLVGVCLTAVALGNGGSLNRVETRRVEHSVQESFTALDINMVDTDMDIRESQDGACYIVCHESEKTTYTFVVEDGTLKVTENDLRVWYDYIGIYTGKPRATLYIPARDYTALTYKGSSGELYLDTRTTSYGSVSVESSSGDAEIFAKGVGDMRVSSSSAEVVISGTSAGNLVISASSGDVELSNVTAESVKIENGSGEIELRSVLASGRIELASSSGDITLDRCDGGELDIASSSGEVEMNLLSGKQFDVATDSGSKSYPPSSGNGKCRVRTSSGDVEITVI